jgi:hypothetical protein
MLFIIPPPELFNFPLEANQESFITGKVNSFRLAHKMAMVLAVAIVVAKYAAIVRGKDTRVNVRQAIFHNLVPFIPNLFFENGSASFT